MQHARLSIHLVLAALLAACSGDATTSPETGGKDSGADALGSDTDVAPDVGADGALDAAPAPCSLQNLGPWKESRALPQPLESASAVVVNGHVFVLGGFSNLKGPLNTVYRARLGQDGALGGWDTLPALPNKVQHHAAFVVGDRIYVTGGDGSKTHDAVHYAVTGSSGELPKWEQAASLPSPRTAHAAVVTDGHVYLLGGMANLTDPASAVASVLYAAVSADGSLGAWKPTTDLPASLFWHSSVVTGGRI